MVVLLVPRSLLSTLDNEMEQAFAKFRDKPQDVLSLVGEHDTLLASHTPLATL